MQQNYIATTAFTKLEEGGYTNDSRDSGNWSSGQTGVGTLIGSNMGCGAPATISYMAAEQPGFIVTAQWMQNLPLQIYDGMAKSRYWNPLQGDLLPSGVDLMCFDFGWNTGIGSAARRLQWLVGASQDGNLGTMTLQQVSNCDITVIAKQLTTDDAKTLQTGLGVTTDGIIGASSIAAINNNPSARAIILCLGLAEAQTAYYKTLYNFSTYGNGWLNRTSSRLLAALNIINASYAPSTTVSNNIPAPTSSNSISSILKNIFSSEVPEHDPITVKDSQWPERNPCQSLSEQLDLIIKNK